MATNQPRDILEERARESDISVIVKSVGENWELLAPRLLDKIALVTVDRIKEDESGHEMCVLKLLLTWLNTNEVATLGYLFHHMLQLENSLSVDWKAIAENLNIEERDIKACKRDYKPPGQEMSTSQYPGKDILKKVASEKDLSIIAISVGGKWEKLGEFLLKRNDLFIVRHIKKDEQTREMRIYRLLSKWRQQADQDATLGYLFHQMLRVGSSLTIDLKAIAEYLNIGERDIKECKQGYQPHAQESCTSQHFDTAILDKQISEKDMHVIALSIGKCWERLAYFLLPAGHSSILVKHTKANTPRDSVKCVYQMLLQWRRSDLQNATRGHLFHQMLKVGISLTVDWKNIADNLEIEERDIKACMPHKEDDLGHGSKNVRIEGVEDNGIGNVVEPVDGNQTDGTKIRVDGRLIKLEEQDISILKEEYTHLIGKGSFGKVYSTSDDTVPADFGIRIALKKIKLRKEEAKNRLVRREMIASRILHPFILPLLAVDYRPSGLEEVWFVSPLCENGDLGTAIKEKFLKEQRTRLKILFHVALAIRYLHTEVPNVRKAILHKDIASKNVVLDAECNARLIDFGLAREIDDDTATATGRSYYCHPKDGRRANATVSWDYYSFGVIIREMLTSLGPKGGEINGTKIYLKEMNSEEVRKNLSKDIWKYEDGAKVLANIAEVCLGELDLRLSGFNTKVVEKIKKIWWRDLNQDRLLDVPEGHAKCHICMINPMATETSMRQDHAPNCRQKIEACIACEKNSFLNPIRCYCDKDLKPTIGSKCGALLVAGNDENKKLAEALKKDIKELKTVITSRAPRIMGISEDMVRMVVPNTPGTLEEREKLWPEVRKHIEFFSNEAEIDTLLIYFSCHGAKHRDGGDIKSQSNVFELGSPSDSITLDEFKKELDCLGNIDKLIIVLDRCYPPKITMNENRKFIQINASRENQRARMTEDGSIFTKYLIQGLKAKSDEKICPSDCKHCTTYWSNRSDFISVTCLFDYVRDHMSKYDDSQPVGDTSLEWRNIAYYTHEKVEIDFTWQQNDQSDKVQKEIPLEFLQTMRQLEEKLCKVFERDMSTTKVKIQKDTFRKRERLQDCDTLEKVMSAWVNRQPLTVKFENS